jgi:peptidoglycan/xylan/chitin deacetylase (PgdA/CDA1 family)
MVFARNARRILQWLWAGFLASSGCLWWAKRQLRANGAIVTLMFHRVLGDADYRRTYCLPAIIVRERAFREFLTHVVRRYEPVDLREAEPGKPGKKLCVAFTFDDGWSDNYTVAFPIARAYRIPLTVFICSRLVGRNTPFWHERIIALLRAVRPAAENGEITALIERLKQCTPETRERYQVKLSKQARKLGMSVEPSSVDGMLSWPEITEMDRAGVTFGSHTQTGQILTTVPVDTARQEVLGSKAAIESALSKRCNVFAYPNGNWSPETRRLLAEAGFELAVTTEPGAWTATCDPLAVPRCNVYEGNLVGPTGRFSPTIFEYTILWKAWCATRANSRLRARAQHQPASATSEN